VDLRHRRRGGRFLPLWRADGAEQAGRALRERESRDDRRERRAHRDGRQRAARGDHSHGSKRSSAGTSNTSTVPPRPGRSSRPPTPGATSTTTAPTGSRSRNDRAWATSARTSRVVDGTARTSAGRRDNRRSGRPWQPGDDGGYWNKPEATEEAFSARIEGYYHTGDLATVDEHGMIAIQDRKKDIIISGGENISSIELEDALFDHEAVSRRRCRPRPSDGAGRPRRSSSPRRTSTTRTPSKRTWSSTRARHSRATRRSGASRSSRRSRRQRRARFRSTNSAPSSWRTRTEWSARDSGFRRWSAVTSRRRTVGRVRTALARRVPTWGVRACRRFTRRHPVPFDRVCMA